MVRRKELVRRIQEKSQGRIKLELYGVGELCQSKENFEAVRAGVADVAHIISAYTPGLFPWSQLIENPFFALPLIDPTKFSYKTISKIAKNINPEFERNGVVPSGLYWLGGTIHIYSKKPLRKIEDFKKVRISCASAVHREALKRLGFLPQIIAGADTYLALREGIVDAALQTHGGAKITRYEEVTKYVTLLNWPQLGFTYVFNPKSLKKLPPDLRSILVNEFRAWHEQVEIGKKWQREQEDLKWLTDRGVKVITLPKEEIEKIRKLLPSFDEWAAQREKYGMHNAGMHF
jgi:TRAP-type C4-dicarboxylate transport system substrate-binding protein